MKQFSLERGGNISYVPIDQIISQVTPETAAKFRDAMALSNIVQLKFLEEPYYGTLRHNEDLPPQETIEGDIPNIFCVELAWNMPVESNVIVVANSAAEANQKLYDTIYDDPSFVYEDIEAAFSAFEPDLSTAIVVGAVGVENQCFNDIKHRILNEEREIYEKFSS